VLGVATAAAATGQVPRVTGSPLLGCTEQTGAAARVRRGACSARLFYHRAPGWGIVFATATLGTCLTYLVRPPASWPGCRRELYGCAGGLQDAEGTCNETIAAEIPYLSEMGCSGPGYLDTHILGVRHMYHQGSDGVTWPPNFGFDPEGVITTLSAVPAMFLGLHAGHVWGTLKEPKAALIHWLALGAVLVIAGSALSFWLPLNKRLWSPSYCLCTTGAATILYAGFFGAVDATALHPQSARAFAGCVRIALAPLQWLGANCILFFVLSDCCGVLDFLLRSITWGQPHAEKNIVAWFQNIVLMKWFNLGAHCSGAYADCGPAVMTYIWVEILAWIVICGVLFHKNIFWKI